MNDAKRVIIEKAQIVTPFGNTEETTDSLYAEKSAVVAENYKGMPVSIAHIPENYPKTTKEIIKYYKDYKQYDSPKTLFIYSVAKGDINALIDENYTEYCAVLEKQAVAVADGLGLSSCKITVSCNACAAGAAAIDTARLFLKECVFETVIIFGFEQISEFTVTGFFALQAISPSGARPFDKNRNGMTLGEGSGLCVLKYAKPKVGDVCILGSGASNDANHRTGPSKTGDGLALAIERALKSASLGAGGISAIKCHGTATSYNDAMEAKALKLVFGDFIPPAVSLKGAIGHLSGAGSMIETVIAAEMLKNAKLAPTIGFEEVGANEEKIPVSSECQAIKGDTLLCLSAGFGGINQALILRRIDAKFTEI